MKLLLRSCSVTALVLGLAACTTPVPQALHPGDVPSNFTAPTTAETANAPLWPALAWWDGFSAPELPPLEKTALEENLDLLAAKARVDQAHARVGISESALFPSLNANGNASRSGTNIAGLPGGNTHNNFSVGGQASYEVDLWGLNRDQLRAAEESELGSRYAAETTRLTITADVANTYLQVLALRQRIAISKQNIAAAQRILAITEAKVQNGVSSNLELAQQRAVVAGQEATIPGLEEQEREARYALAILLGRAPEGFSVNEVKLDGIVAPAVRAGLPTELLERRPDVAQAEASLRAAHANVDAARAAFFPHVNLSGSITQAFNPSTLAWSIGASLLQSVFDGGNLASQSDLAKAQQMELLVTYRKTVFSALSDTESAMGQVSSLQEQERLVTIQEQNAAEAYRIAELQYREGVTDLLNVLQTQQTLFNTQDNLVQIRLARLQAGVSLYRALGGGWTVATDPNAPEDRFSPLHYFPIAEAITGGP
ncbi:MAG: efflux transporter outer membrane subunit [Alphaproteobacteria bacterium]|nr:efflux transporter outer membrane subunit [Alphaproteobacteria bacterium]MBL6937389.1 efflux transporter outer membrane subunit [Alphaproteobacteria bacterium]MBL7096049.1 efflux transporter outer membrane subunit [Alphaproteobacteria bacterium]